MRTAPSLRDWAEAAIGLAVLAVAAWAVPAIGGAAAFDPALPGLTADPAAFAALALIAVIVPALGEELVFRGVLQPDRPDGAAALAASAASLALFVAWHPIQIALSLPAAQPVFAEPGFLALAGLLGLVCTVLVHRSGSLWTAVALHWAVVVIWKAGSG